MLSLQSRVRGDKPDHFWTMVLHADGCHHYTSVFRCEDCGATLRLYAERDLNFDPYSAIWMDTEIPEEEGGACARCRELIDGATPRYERELILA